jgi:hypothetical protein
MNISLLSLERSEIAIRNSCAIFEGHGIQVVRKPPWHQRSTSQWPYTIFGRAYDTIPCFRTYSGMRPVAVLNNCLCG